MQVQHYIDSCQAELALRELPVTFPPSYNYDPDANVPMPDGGEPQTPLGRRLRMRRGTTVGDVGILGTFSGAELDEQHHEPNGDVSLARSTSSKHAPTLPPRVQPSAYQQVRAVQPRLLSDRHTLGIFSASPAYSARAWCLAPTPLASDPSAYHYHVPPAA